METEMSLPFRGIKASLNKPSFFLLHPLSSSLALVSFLLDPSNSPFLLPFIILSEVVLVYLPSCNFKNSLRSSFPQFHVFGAVTGTEMCAL